MPQRHIFQRRRDCGTHDTGKAGQIFCQYRVPLVRHGRGALLPGREKFFHFPQFGTLKMADFCGKPFDRAGNDSERGKEHGVAVPRDHLR